MNPYNGIFILKHPHIVRLKAWEIFRCQCDPGAGFEAKVNHTGDRIIDADPEIAYEEMSVGNMETGQSFGREERLPPWFFDPMLRAMKLIEWKEMKKNESKKNRKSKAKV